MLTDLITVAITALVKIVHDILWSMENQECTNLMAIDLPAAFDMVDHVILLDVLQKRFGIEGVALSLFDNYLCPRSCKVNVGKVYSSSRELECCVPQGSCAGPILYTAYASTLESVVLEADNHDHNMECETIWRVITEL